MSLKNYIIGALVVIILFLISVVYRQHNTMVYHNFPVPSSLIKDSGETPLYVFLFFSKKNCKPCIANIIDILNTLPPYFRTAGIVPDEELMNKEDFKQLFGATFPLYGYRKFKRYLPWHMPTLLGVSPSGKVVLVIPGIKGQEASLEKILLSIHGKFQYSFMKLKFDSRSSEKRTKE